MPAPLLPPLAPTRAILAITAVALLWAGCSRDQDELTGPQVRPAEILQDLRPAIYVQERHTERLTAIPGVVGTAVGLTAHGEAAVNVFTVGPDV